MFGGPNPGSALLLVWQQQQQQQKKTKRANMDTDAHFSQTQMLNENIRHHYYRPKLGAK